MKKNTADYIEWKWYICNKGFKPDTPCILDKIDEYAIVTSVVFNADGSTAAFMRYAGNLQYMPHARSKVKMADWSFYWKWNEDKNCFEYQYILKAAA
jgi:hypothetical protein